LTCAGRDRTENEPDSFKPLHAPAVTHPASFACVSVAPAPPVDVRAIIDVCFVFHVQASVPFVRVEVFDVASVVYVPGFRTSPAQPPRLMTPDFTVDSTNSFRFDKAGVQFAEPFAVLHDVSPAAPGGAAATTVGHAIGTAKNAAATLRMLNAPCPAVGHIS